MGDLPCKGCKGLCCGPVPISERELRHIKKHIKKMPAKRRDSLKNQQRFLGTCIFFDEANDCCGIHSVRPAICRAFGHHQKTSSVFASQKLLQLKRTTRMKRLLVR